MGILTCPFRLLDKAMNLPETIFLLLHLPGTTGQALVSDPAKELLFNGPFITVFFCSSVDGGHRAVIFDRFRGIQEAVVGEGTHFLIPWVQKPIIFDCRSRPRNVPVITGSKGRD